MKFAWLILSFLLVACGASFVFFTYLIASDTVLPALARGTLSVDTDSMVLNVLWQGNEIYFLIAIYLTAAATFIAAGVLLAKRAIRRRPL
jgi:hypothetical protein